MESSLSKGSGPSPECHDMCRCVLGQTAPSECSTPRFEVAWFEDDGEVGDGNNNHIFENMEGNIRNVIEGSLKDLSALPSNTIRIFISSTFTDFSAERNILPKKAFPELRRFCRDLGLDLEIVDMRWGLTDDVINDHQVSELCINEIENCKNVSCGPYFVIFLGNRYGYRPMPAKIGAGEFEMLMSIIQEQNPQGHKLLLEWFKRDDNNSPAEYLLQPISQSFKFYGDYREESKERREIEVKEWNKIYNIMTETLRQSVTVAIKQGLISNETSRKYFHSVTEHEIREGLFTSPCPGAHVLCYNRNLVGIYEAPSTEHTSVYSDMNDDVRPLRDKLLKEVNGILPEENNKIYNVKWKGEALKGGIYEYDAYLTQFETDFVQDMKKLICRNIPVVEENLKRITSLYYEVLHHARFANSKLDIFCGRNEEIEQIKTYLTNTSTVNNTPFIVTGESGLGKTALMAYVAAHVREWVSPEAVNVVRFLGTSPQSYDIVYLLQSIIVQLSAIYVGNYSFPQSDRIPIWDLKKKLFSMLESISGRSTKSLVIILDAVDQLRDDEVTFDMLWLPRTLPKNVKFVVSMLSDRFGCLENTQKRIQDSTKYLHIEPLSGQSIHDVMSFKLKTHSRSLQAQQKKCIADIALKCSQPLFLTLLMDFALQIHSYSDFNFQNIPGDVQAAINSLFSTFETQYGKVFVSHALGYLTCGQAGLSSLEMNDVLSCDDLVLNEVYQYHDPPLEGIIRIPQLMWARLKHALREYLTDRLVDGKTVSTWYHRQFWEVAEKRYLSDDGHRHKLHSNLALIFMQENGVRRTIILRRRGGKMIENADRDVTPQPLSSQNARKLSTVPHHLYHANRIKDLRTYCLLNFDWVFIRLQSVEVFCVMKEYKDWADIFEEDEELQLFYRFIKVAMIDFMLEPKSFAYRLKESFRQANGKGPLIEKLLTAGTKWLKKTKEAVLVPTHSIDLYGINCPIEYDLPFGSQIRVSHKFNILISAWDDKNKDGLSLISVLELDTKKLIESHNESIIKQNTLVFSEDEQLFSVSHQDGVLIYDTRSGDILKQITCTKTQELGKMSVTTLALGNPLDSGAVAIALTPEDTTTVLCVVDTAADSILHSLKFCHQIGTMHLVENDSKLVITSKEAVSVYEVKTMTLVSIISHFGELQVRTVIVSSDPPQVVCLAFTANSVRFLAFDYLMNRHTLTDLHNFATGCVSTFGMCCIKGNTYISGIRLLGSKEDTIYLCVWEPSDNNLKKILIKQESTGHPVAVVAMTTRPYAFVGWLNGYISVIDLGREEEVMLISDVGEQMLNNMLIANHDNDLITSSEDNSVRFWKIDRILDRSVRNETANESVEQEHVTINAEEYCNDITIANGCCVTVPPDPNEAPSFWKLSNGDLMRDMSEAVDKEYKDSLARENICLEGFKKGGISTLDEDVFVYERSGDDKLFIGVIQGYNEPKMKANMIFEHCKKHIIVDMLHQSDTSDFVIVLRTTHLEAYGLPFLSKQNSVALPVPVQEHDQACKRCKDNDLRMEVTLDGRFCYILNPWCCPKREEFRSFDIVDLHANSFVMRCEVPFQVHSGLFEFGCCSMVWDETNDPVPHLYYLSDLESKKSVSSTGTTYRCFFYSKQFLSIDKSIGVEISKNKHKVFIWNLNPLQRLQTLIDPRFLMNPTCVTVSHDNKYIFLVSVQRGLMAWNIGSGDCVAKYWMNTDVEKIIVSPTARYVAVQTHSGLRKTKAIIFRAHNLSRGRRTNKFYSREDL